MLKNENIICISTIDWDFIWQGHQEIMSTLAAEGNKVLFIENTGVRSAGLRDIPRLKKRILNWFKSVKGVRKERENLFVYSPVILPFPYSRIARWVNKRLVVSAIKRLARTIGLSDPVIWTFLPTGITLDIMDEIDHKLIVYYCIDNFAASSHSAKKVLRTENELIKRSDLVFVTAQNLYERCAPFNKNVHLFPFGVNIDVYRDKRLRPVPAPADIARISHPIAGYVGGVHKWLDFELIRFLAGSRPEISFVFVGPLQRKVDSLKGLPNIHFLGQKCYEELPGYIAHFNACLIPYLITDYTKNVYPTKINEYLSMGKPVVSTAIPEVEAFNRRNRQIAEIGGSSQAYLTALDKAVSEKDTGSLAAKRIEIAEKESSWRVKIEKISGLIEAQARRREEALGANWKDNFLALYKGTRERLIPALLVAGALYVALFYTPLVWYAAEPLRVSGAPKKCDVIAVFAGGVGESGKAGQGYQERVERAAELYKEGYAGHVIFSSGYTYFFKEPLIMKALAVSLGVPAEAIILEDKAKNTVDNVRNTRKILLERGWKNAVVVTSLYHTRRVSLVCNKIAPEITVSYAPTGENTFYYHAAMDEYGRRIWKRATFAQIKALAHEYIAILYYLVKRYAKF